MTSERKKLVTMKIYLLIRYLNLQVERNLASLIVLFASRWFEGVFPSKKEGLASANPF